LVVVVVVGMVVGGDGDRPWGGEQEKGKKRKGKNKNGRK
jgi:hypothetical protein